MPRGKKQNVFADDDEQQQPNDAFNKAIEAAKQGTPPNTTPETSLAPSTPSVAPAEVPAVAIPQPPEPPPAIQQSSKPVIQQTSNPANQKPDRAGPGYTKATHRIRDDAFQALEDMKLLLKRQHGFKRILLEEIVEATILGIKQDLDEHRDQSILVKQLQALRQPENQ